MEIRGERECRSCGARWSYYRTGSVTCPDCGSAVSVGVDERTKHTDTADSLDLSAARAAAADGPIRDAADAAASDAREYVRERGFLDAGDLRRLDDVYLGAVELAGVAEYADRTLDLSDDEERHFLALLRGADEGERPTPEEVPASIAPVRGLAYATGVRDYRRALSAWLDDRETPPEAGTLLERLDDHVRRVRALDGDVPPADAERLVEAARSLAAYVRDDDAAALEVARARLSALS